MNTNELFASNTTYRAENGRSRYCYVWHGVMASGITVGSIVAILLNAVLNKVEPEEEKGLTSK